MKPGPGLITLTIEDVLRRIKAERRTRCHRLRLSMLEVYNEMVNDLLSPRRTNLRLYEHAGGVLVSGISEYDFALDGLIDDDDALAVLLRAAERQRHTGSTSANNRSSRSHLVCTLTVDSWEAEGEPERAPNRAANRAASDDVDGAADSASVLRSTLQLVDLAGSERRQTASESSHPNERELSA